MDMIFIIVKSSKGLGEYNKAGYNKLRGKLEAFIDRVKSGDYRFTTDDFRNVSMEGYTDKSFFLC